MVSKFVILLLCVLLHYHTTDAFAWGRRLAGGLSKPREPTKLEVNLALTVGRLDLPGLGYRPRPKYYCATAQLSMLCPKGIR